MPQIGVGVSITLPYGRIGVTGGSSGDPDPMPGADPYDLLWGDDTRITWRGDTIIDWPGI